MENRQRTPLALAIKEIDLQQKRYIEIAKKDKKLRVGVNAILTATSLLKMSLESLKPKEREMLESAWNNGMESDNGYFGSFEMFEQTLTQE